VHAHFVASLVNQLVGAYVLVFRFSWEGLAVALAGHALVESLGTAIAYHRCLSHRSLELAKPVEYLFALIGGFAFHGDPLQWVTIHRQHHRYSDHDGDPHGAHRGLAYSHLLWFDDNFFPRSSPEEQRRYAPDLLAQPFYRAYPLIFPVFGLLVALGMWALFGWEIGILWGAFVRHLFGCHATFSVNSICHAYGFRAYRRNDLSTNCAWLALPTMGESWHNNHHAFPSSARAGLRWWQVDLSWWVICGLRACGLARNVKQPSAEEVAAGSGPRTLGELVGVRRPEMTGYRA